MPYDLPKPIKYDKRGPLFSTDQVNESVMRSIVVNDYFFRRIKVTAMSEDYDKAAKLLDDAKTNFDNSLNRMLESSAKLETGVKQSSSKIKDSANKLGNSLAKIEQLADFNRMERYVDLLERAEKAMSALAELEKSGVLGKISQAINTK